MTENYVRLTWTFSISSMSYLAVWVMTIFVRSSNVIVESSLKPTLPTCYKDSLYNALVLSDCILLFSDHWMRSSFFLFQGVGLEFNCCLYFNEYLIGMKPFFPGKKIYCLIKYVMALPENYVRLTWTFSISSTSYLAVCIMTIFVKSSNVIVESFLQPTLPTCYKDS
jgi:hypothetical protein